MGEFFIKIILVFTLFQCPTFLVAQECERIYGNIGLNPFAIQGLYGLNEQAQIQYQDTIDFYLKKAEVQEILDARVEEFLFLKENNLLKKPYCFLFSGDKEYRIYFDEQDIQSIQKTDWLNKFNHQNIQISLEVEALKLRDCIYQCQQILTIKGFEVIPRGFLDLEEDIEIEPTQLTYEEIDSLYLNSKNANDTKNMEMLLPHLKHYFEWMKSGSHPFEMYENKSIEYLKTDTTTLRIYLEELLLHSKY